MARDDGMSEEAKGKPRAPKGRGGKLVVVESKAKAVTLERFLGKGYRVIASMGHVRDLPTLSIGVNIKNGFEPLYVIPREKRMIVGAIRDAAKDASDIIVATDPDREGEAIAWHLVHACDLSPEKLSRATFHEITERAIGEALEQLHEIDMNLVESQQARRILDRLVGYTISPLLANRIQGSKSAGRVQSVALRFLVEREREIRDFVPREWWSIEANFATSQGSPATFKAVLEPVEGKLELAGEAEVNQVLAQLEGATYRVDELAERVSQRRPQAPFVTASLQRAASTELRMGPSATMRIAQQLYEGVSIGAGGREGLITYMRTDSVQVAAEARADAKRYVTEVFGESFAPKRPNVFQTRTRNAQEAHEAIRPTSVFRTPESLAPHLDRRQLQVYELIWRRFVASQMAPATVRTVTVLAGAHLEGRTLEFRFRSSASQVIFAGHFAVIRPEREPDEQDEAARALILALKEGDSLLLRGIDGVQHFTEPPPRFSEANLIRALEEEGIGRPSTYAPTIETLQTRAYAELEGRALRPTELGERVTDALVEHFPDIVDKAFTRRMEAELDEIAGGKRDRLDLLSAFWERLDETLVRAQKDMEKVKAPQEPTGEACPRCGKELVVRLGKSGRFIGCTGFPECDYFSWKRPVAEKCPRCGGQMYAALRGTVRCEKCEHTHRLGAVESRAGEADSSA